jgi:hypothetical protein
MPGGPYGEWNNIGAIDIGQLVVGNAGDGSIQLFGIGRKNGIWSIRQATPASDLAGWTKLSGQRLNFYPHQFSPD